MENVQYVGRLDKDTGQCVDVDRDRDRLRLHCPWDDNVQQEQPLQMESRAKAPWWKGAMEWEHQIKKREWMTRRR